MIRTSTRQDARFYAAYLQYCLDHLKTSFGYTYLWLKDHAAIVMGTPLIENSEDFDEQLRTAEFHKYCDAVDLYLIYINMYRVEDEFIKPDHPYPIPPVEVSYVRVTRFGRFYLRLPFWLQVAMVYTIEKVMSFAFAWKRYKWLGSLTGLVIGLTGWNKTHQISSLLVLGSTLAGLLTAWLVSAVTGYLGGDDHGLVGNDPLD